MRMKRVLGVVVVAWLACPSPAHALLFSDLIDFDGPGLGPGTAGSLSVFDNAPPPWLHDIADNVAGHALGGIDITDASLAVSYAGTDGNESWSLLGDGVALGALLSTGTPVFTTTFALDLDALAALRSDGLFSVVPVESTTGRDGFRLYEATLSGHYTVADTLIRAIPEPTPSLLVIFGLLNLFFRYRNRTT